VYLPDLKWRGSPIHLRGISVPLATIQDAVLLPNGSRAVDHKAQIAACFHGVEGTTDDALGKPILVSATLAGYKVLSFQFLPGEPVPVHYMQAK
jgi:hypothetical protein